MTKSAIPTPPIAPVKPFQQTIHGITLVDNYAWLKDRDRTNQEVLDYIEAENSYTDQMMKHTMPMQNDLFQEIVSRIKETDLAVPVKRDQYFYYSRTEKGKQYSIHCRKKDYLDAPEEIILDVNEIARDHDYFTLDATYISPDHRYYAYTADVTGQEKFELAIKDLTIGQMLSDRIPNISSFAWANDNLTFFYTIDNEANRSYQAYRHVLGTDPVNDVLIYHDPDDAYYVWVEKTKSQEYIILGSNSSKTSEIRFLDANTPFGTFTLIHAREQGLEYYPVHHGGLFYIYTNAAGAKNYKIVTAPVTDPGLHNWQDYVPGRETVFLSNYDVVQNHLIVFEREKGLERMRLFDLRTNQDHYLDFPEPIYTIQSQANPEFETPYFRFSYMSLITPYTVYDYDLEQNRLIVKKQEEVLGGYDPGDYESERLFATAADGVQVPISLVYKKSLFQKNGSNPLFLEAYGAYGISSDPYFSSIRLSLLDRGFIYAIAHVRGGHELGEDWYEQGRMLKKMNTFTDFIACAEHLIQAHYTSSQKLVIYGGSAGGLLLGAVTNLRPDLCAIVLADVPFVDVLNTMLDPTLAATVSEYEEWGNPTIKEYFDSIRSYCPYQNVKAQNYPHMLIMGGFYDPRVNFWEPAKWTAKLRALKTDSNRLLLRINMSGHGGASGRYDFIKEIAFGYAFVFDILKIPYNTTSPGINTGIGGE
ncbi:S9 family peptidase [bacterium]|nr:S9 family peptidase [bacterium]